MQAILLAGGLGTRLRSVVSDRPKPMALIQGRPFMEYVIRELALQGIDQIIFAVGYKGSMVEEYFGDGRAFGIKASYAYEETLLGTAGAIKNGARYMEGEQVLVLNADTFYRLDYGRLRAQKEEQELDMALVLRQVEDVGNFLLEWMPLLLVPASTSFLTVLDTIQGMLLPVLVMGFIGTMAVMFAAGHAAQWMIRLRKGAEGNE